MTADVPRPAPAAPRIDGGRLELVAAVVLSIATVLTAWSAFQATKWGGVMSVAFSEANAARTLAVQQSDVANTQTAVDVTLFAEYAAAVAAGDDDLANFLQQRFRDEFRPAFDAWVALDPLVDLDAPPSPFDLEDYVVDARLEFDRLLAQAESSGEFARQANQRGDNYVLTTVLFASVLFFAGVSTKANSPRVQLAMVSLAGILLVAGALILTTFPVEI